jgi:hypothetical protein
MLLFSKALRKSLGYRSIEGIWRESLSPRGETCHGKEEQLVRQAQGFIDNQYVVAVSPPAKFGVSL